MANVAKSQYDKVYVGDLNEDTFVEKIVSENNNFDFIVLGDILEHLIDPYNVLKTFAKTLNEEGKVVISVPNIGHLDLFIQIYKNGKWPRNNRGIFDKTHLSWFTKQNLMELIEYAGLKEIKYSPNYRARDKINSKFNLFDKVLKKLKPELYIFQHIIVCKRA